MTEQIQDKKQASLQQIHIHSLSQEGRGVGTLENGKTCFVRGALPGEKVTLQLTKRRSKFACAEADQIESPSAYRIQTACAFADRCGGCSLQHVDPTFQIQHKTKTVLEQLKHFAQITWSEEDMAPPLLGPTAGYRRKARLGVRYVQKKDRVLVGFREHHTHYIADIDSCTTLHPLIGERIHDLAVYLAQCEAKASIPQIEVVVGDDHEHPDMAHLLLVLRHLAPLSEHDRAILKTCADKLGLELWLQPGGPSYLERLWPEADEDACRLGYALRDHNLWFDIKPHHFIQVNAHINQAMINQALAWLSVSKHDRVLDLCCGIGNFSLPLAQKAGYVLGLELSEESVKQAQDNARQQNLKHVDFDVCDVSRPLDDLALKARLEEGFDVVLIDPPRSGIDAFITEITQLVQSKSILYVSCHSATFARDVGLLQEQGYHLQKLGVMDMFPHTTHIECMGLLVKEKNELKASGT